MKQATPRNKNLIMASHSTKFLCNFHVEGTFGFKQQIVSTEEDL